MGANRTSFFFTQKTFLFGACYSSGWSKLLQWLEQVTPMVGASCSRGWSKTYRGFYEVLGFDIFSWVE